MARFGKAAASKFKGLGNGKRRRLSSFFFDVDWSMLRPQEAQQQPEMAVRFSRAL